MYELKPTDGRKSFNGKCKVMELNNVLTLVSYNTNVAYYDKSTEQMYIKDIYSPTTLRHLKAFCHHCGIDVSTKRDLQPFIDAYEKRAPHSIV